MIVLLVGRRGSEGAGMKGQLGVNILQSATQGSASVVVGGGGDDVDEKCPGRKSAHLHKSSGDEDGLFCLLDLRATGDAGTSQNPGGVPKQ